MNHLTSFEVALVIACAISYVFTFVRFLKNMKL